MDESRRAYNQAKYAHQKKMNEAIKRFAAEHPVRYAELLAIAKAEPIVKQEPIQRHYEGDVHLNVTIPYHLRYRPDGSRREWPLSDNDIYEICFAPDERDFFITSKDAYGTEYFGMQSGLNVSDAFARKQQRWPEHTVTLVKAVECRCPMCVRRHSEALAI